MTKRKAALTPRQFAKALKIRNLTVAAAAAELGKTERQVYRYLNGDSPVPILVARAFATIAGLGKTVF